MASHSARTHGIHRGNRGAGSVGSTSPHREQWPDVSQSDVLRIRGGQIGPCTGMHVRDAAVRQAISSSKPLVDAPTKPTKLSFEGVLSVLSVSESMLLGRLVSPPSVPRWCFSRSSHGRLVVSIIISLCAGTTQRRMHVDDLRRATTLWASLPLLNPYPSIGFQCLYF